MDFSVAIRVHTPVGKSSHDGLSSTKTSSALLTAIAAIRRRARSQCKRRPFAFAVDTGKLNAISSNQDVLKDALRSDREKGGLNLIFESCQFKLTEKVSQAGAFVADVMVVFDDHLPDRLSLPGRKQIAEDAVFSAFYVQLEKVNRPLN